MIVGIGTDIVAIERIEKSYRQFGQRFIDKILGPKERLVERSEQQWVHYLAKRFAAKEALVKALGCGFRGGVCWHDIQVAQHDSGQPHIELSGRSRELLEQKGKSPKVHLSISDEKHYAVANVVIEAV